METQSQLKNQNNLFEFVNFDSNDFKVYFKYLGSSKSQGVARLTWRGLTVHYAEMEFQNSNYFYFISLNDQKVWDFVDVMNLEIEVGETTQIFEISNLEYNKNFDFLSNFQTEKNDVPFWTFKEIFLDNDYENPNVKVEEGDIVVDIGANYGFYVQKILENKPSKIYCFEPTPNVFKKLKNNFSGHNEIHFYEKAVTNKCGTIKFINDVGSASNRISENSEGYEVECLDINELIMEIGEEINFMKVDCEGCEKEIFEHITTENLNKIKKIVVEFHSEDIKSKLIKRFQRDNFSIEQISNNIIFAFKKDILTFKEKKKIVLISTFCDTDKKMRILKQNLKTLKSLGIDTMVIAPNFLTVDEEIIKISDFVFYTKENPLLKYPTRHYTHWYELQLEDGRVITLHRGFADYGWAALYQTKKLSQLALTFDYDLFYHIIYDVELDEILLSELLNQDSNIIHPRRNPNHPEEIWETTLHFMVFDREMMKKIEKEITLEEYLSTNGVAEGEVLKWTKKFDIKISEHCVKDKIFYWENFDFFNVSPFPDFKMFISKNPELQIWLGYQNPYPEQLTSNFRIVFYDIPENFEIILILDDKKFTLKPKNWNFIELPVNSQKIKQIKLIYNGSEKDFSDEYNNIMMNQIYYNHRP